jgi:hypothetical protein
MESIKSIREIKNISDNVLREATIKDVSQMAKINTQCRKENYK